jgi:hypothetical protein
MGRRRSSRIVAIVLCSLLTAVAASVRAEVTSGTPEAIFQDRGLVRYGKWLVFPAEGELHDRVWLLKQSDEAVRSTTSTHRSLLPQVMRDLESMNTLVEQRDAADKHIDDLKGKTDDQSIDDYNNTITQSDVCCGPN